MDWILCLLITYIHHSEIHVITMLSLLYSLQFNVTHTLGFSVFTSRFLATDIKQVIITRKVFFSQADFQISYELIAISSQSSSTAVSRDSLNSISAGPGS
jgi:hypothetical protein